MKEVAEKLTIQSYIDNNRQSLDESLVSLRFMKEIDQFLDYTKMSNKELATRLGYSESYISQLMSGTKNINVSFLNKFEKVFSAQFDIRIYLKGENAYLHKLDEKAKLNINIKLNVVIINEQSANFTINQSNQPKVSVPDIAYKTL